MAHLRNCILCGTQYDYCPRCDETRPTFYLKYCSDNCKNISLILNKFNFKHLTKEEAAEELKKCDLSKLDKFNNAEKDRINEILQVEKPVDEIIEVADITDPYEEIKIEPEKIEPEKKEIKKVQVINKYNRKTTKKKPIVNEI